MRLLTLALLTLTSASLSHAEPFTGPPEGYAIVAEDDCGNRDLMPHVVRGTVYVFPSGLVTGPLPERDIVFDNDFCLLRYEKLNPAAQYKVDVVYVTEAAGARQQTLEANGLPVHDSLNLPASKPGRFLFDLPREAYAEGQPVELKFIRAGGANAVVSYVRLWSTDPTRLPAKGNLWAPNGPVELDWRQQDRLLGKPVFAEWADPAGEVRDSVLPCVDEQLARAQAILADLEALDAPGLAASREELARSEARRDELVRMGSLAPTDWLDLYRSLRWAVRRLALKNPLLPRDELLFVRRHHPHAMHQCARRLGAFTLPGGGICILSGLSAEGEPQVRCLTDGLFPRGTFGRPDISPDGKRIVFGFAPERQAGRRSMGYGNVSEGTAPIFAEHQAGPCEAFQVWEMTLDGSAPPRQLTQGPAENSDPLYLPDGRIAFMSHRAGGLVQCGDWALAYCLYTMNPDGSDVRKITMSKDGEWDPFLLQDGTLGFTRWEYVMKFWSPIQMLWSVRPDGTNPRLIYGSDLSRTYAYPLNYASARPIPGTSKLVCIGSAHHNTGAGPVCLVDLAIGPSEADGLQRLTPVRFVETPDQQPDAGWYDCPYPLSDKYFLVSYSLSPDETDTTAYGLYLLDAYGGRELLYRDEELSALFPMPLRPKATPAVPAVVSGELGTDGEFLIQDIHAGLPEEMQGKARYVQIVECHERHIHTTPYAVEVGPDSGFETKTVLGTVPVEADGSAYFRLPADKSVFFSVLDEQYRALHTMRSVTNVQAGERTSCVGCHEGTRRVPAAHRPLAVLREPSTIEPPPWGERPMDFAALVQPVLERSCVRCHGGAEAKEKAPDFTAKDTQPFMGVPLPGSYYRLRQYVRHAPMFSYSLPPGSFGSRVSPVMDLLGQGHHDVSLDPADWRLLCAWIDCNAPGFGDYEVAARGKHDIRRRAEIASRRKQPSERREALAKALPPGQRLVAYLDCGPELRDGEDGAVVVRETVGSPYAYGSHLAATEPWLDDISFEGREVVYELSGLRPDRQYLLGFSWWDHNNAGREQAVVAIAEDGSRRVLLPRTRLPAWSGRSERPAELTVALPPDLTRPGALALAFTNEVSVANAVVSEVWVVEKR